MSHFHHYQCQYFVVGTSFLVFSGILFYEYLIEVFYPKRTKKDFIVMNDLNNCVLIKLIK